MGIYFVSIRLARFTDHWRRAFARTYPVRYEKLEYGGLRSLHDDTITFAKGITAIVGGNGAGKSTLAHAAIEVLSGSVGLSSLSGRTGRLAGANLQAHVVTSNTARDFSLTVSESGRVAGGDGEVAHTWLEPAHTAMLCQRQILGDSAFEDLLESAGSRDLKELELESASYVVGKNYTKCTVWEISDYALFDILPYFRVTCGGVTYGSEGMGSGELALLLCLWTLNNAPKNSIVILEEPETHVSSRSQDALMDLVAWACDVRGLWIVITTHSPVVLRKLPDACIRLLVNDGGKSKLLASPLRHQLAAVLGGGVAYRNLLLVEDECAKFFVRAILEQIDPDLQYQLTVVVASGGESRISGVLKKLPHVHTWSILGAFDGDQRGEVDATEFEWPHVFLPTDLAPDELLRSAVGTAEGRARFAQAISVQLENVVVALEASAGLDHHDWIPKCSEALGLEIGNVVRGLVRAWLVANESTARAFVIELRQAIDRSLRPLP